MVYRDLFGKFLKSEGINGFLLNAHIDYLQTDFVKTSETI